MADEKEVFESEESVEAAEVKSEDAANWYVVHT